VTSHENELVAVDTEARERLERVRESITMALYVGLSLQAVLLTTPSPSVEDDRTGVALTIFLTALGLLVAHQVAFRLSTRLLNRGVVDADALATLRAQTLGGLPVAFIAAGPVLVLGQAGLVVAEVMLLSFVGVVGFAAARASGTSRRRAAMYVLLLVVLVAAVLALKIVVKH
jgi:hypothetical protein